ncbi:MAG: hypothetical protein IT285_02040 [Bdellovibrionales bacterium]|nr:hypothetical protein [Bdellovibrionales bacterium]
MSEKNRSVGEMSGDFFREAAVLVWVFALVEKLLEKDDGISVGYVLGVTGVTLLFFVLGVILERRKGA